MTTREERPEAAQIEAAVDTHLDRASAQRIASIAFRTQRLWHERNFVDGARLILEAGQRSVEPDGCSAKYFDCADAESLEAESKFYETAPAMHADLLSRMKELYANWTGYVLPMLDGRLVQVTSLRRGESQVKPYGVSLIKHAPIFLPLIAEARGVFSGGLDVEGNEFQLTPKKGSRHYMNGARIRTYNAKFLDQTSGQRVISMQVLD
jgi:hypothetical protein